MGRQKVNRFVNFDHSFNWFDAWKYKSNEYLFRMGKQKVSTRMVNTFQFENLQEKIIPYKVEPYALTIIKDQAIKRFHPNKIDNKAFWVRAHQSFPLISVCGAESKSIKQVNANNTLLSNNMKLLPFLFEKIEKKTTPLTLLEIGFGHGNIFHQIKDKCEYIGIDYVIPQSLKKYKNFIELDKSGIPDYLRDTNYFNIIYSVNVLQHCSQQDRFDYFKQGYNALKPGGYFLFACLIMTKENKDEIYWGIKDKYGRGYMHFFNQLTEVDYQEELNMYLHGLGYLPVSAYLYGNNLSAIIQKPK
jgi:ubiquinone/menaquinone biosynthesis C-methylase UbiE